MKDPISIKRKLMESIREYHKRNRIIKSAEKKFEFFENIFNLEREKSIKQKETLRSTKYLPQNALLSTLLTIASRYMQQHVERIKKLDFPIETYVPKESSKIVRKKKKNGKKKKKKKNGQTGQVAKTERLIHMPIVTAAPFNPIWRRYNNKKRKLKYWTFWMVKAESDPGNIYLFWSDKDDGIVYQIMINGQVTLSRKNCIYSSSGLDGSSQYTFPIHSLSGKNYGSSIRYVHMHWETGNIYHYGPLSEWRDCNVPIIYNSLFDNTIINYVRNHITNKWYKFIIWYRKVNKLINVNSKISSLHFIVVPNDDFPWVVSNRYLSITLISVVDYPKTIFFHVSASKTGVYEDVKKSYGYYYCTQDNVLCGKSFLPDGYYSMGKCNLSRYNYLDWDTGEVFGSGSIKHFEKTFLPKIDEFKEKLKLEREKLKKFQRISKLIKDREALIKKLESKVQEKNISDERKLELTTLFNAKVAPEIVKRIKEDPVYKSTTLIGQLLKDIV